MESVLSQSGSVMRLFQAKAKAGCAEALLKKFATTSATVVENEPGNEGYVFGRGIADDNGLVIFASFWKDLDAVKQRFGADWQSSFLPEGYDALIEECSVRHIELAVDPRFLK